MTVCWSNVTFVVDAEQVEAINSLLEMFMVHAITTENAGDDEFYEVAFPGKPDWRKVSITGLFDDATDLQAMIEFIHNKMESEIPTQVEQLHDQDWERVCLDSFTPIKVGTNLWVVPSWCEPIEPTARNIILDPGLAFGTGTHATTAMCLEWIADQSLEGQSVLDYGSGSGILAIASLLSGASHADAVDIDPLAVQACNENAERNKVSNKLEACLPDTVNSRQYDLVIANILASVIIELRDVLTLNLTRSGTLLLTGILNTQADSVIQSFSSQFSFKRQSSDQWCFLIGSRANT